MEDVIDIPDRDHEHESVLGIVFDISPAQASVLSCLCRSKFVPSEQLLQFTGAKSAIKVVVSRTRAKIKVHGLDIHSRMGVGYWMEPKDKATIERLVSKFVEEK